MRRRPIGLAVLAHAVIDGSVNTLPVILPVLADRFHLNYAQIGLAAALLNLFSSVIQPGFGYLADRWHTRWFIPAGIAWTGALLGTLGFVPSFLALLAVIVCTGFGSAAFHPVASIAVARASGSQRGFGMSLFSAGGNLGFAIGPVIAAWLMTRFGLPGTVAIAAPSLLMALALQACREEFEVATPRPAAAPRQKTAPIPWRQLGILCAAIILRSWAYSGLLIFIPLLLREQGVSLETTGYALFVFLFSGAVGGLIGGHLSDRVGLQQVMAISLLAFPPLMAAAMVVPGALRWILWALAGTALLASFSVTTVFAQELIPERLGLASGLSLGLAFGAGGVGVGLSGMLADLAGLPASVWFLNGLPGVAGLLALMLRAPISRGV
ncbi:MAG: MFS transporter [candidate division NC10 bacterium]|nr:MFS transporter [candidate division NC10 bacterium]